MKKLIIICPIHGEFEQKPNKHLSAQGCRACGLKRTNDAHRLSLDDFVNKAKIIHNNLYDYSLITEFNGVRNKVDILCKEHGIFKQNANKHLSGQICPKCSFEQNLIRCRALAKTTEQFILEARKIHGNEYDYSLVEYIVSDIKIKILCPVHGIFEQQPSNHLIGQKCPRCQRIKVTLSQRSNIDQFIKSAKLIHGDRYDYSLSEYINATKKIKIICKEHGEFLQIPNSHLSAKGCPKCAGNILKTNEEFIKQAKLIHGDRYDYSLVKYTTAKEKVKIICSIHGEFLQHPNGHLLGKNCKKCSKFIRRNLLSTEMFIKQSIEKHGYKYDYSKSLYKGAKELISIICPEHGIFEQLASIHKRGANCPKCISIVSKGEKELVEYIKTIYIGHINENDRKQIKPKELDIYLPDLKIAIEYNGEYWHNLKEEKDPGCHQLKEDLCKAKGITLINISDKDWVNNKDQIKELIKSYII